MPVLMGQLDKTTNQTRTHASIKDNFLISKVTLLINSSEDCFFLSEQLYAEV